MKKIAGLILVLLFTSVFAQQLPQYSQWYFHQFAGNPAHAGIKKCVDIHALYRAQWVGFAGAPRGGFLTLSVPLDSKRRQYLSARHGMGLKFENDQIGAFDFNRINIAYAGHFNFNADRRLSLGIYAGAVQLSYDPSYVLTIDADPSVYREGSGLAPDASFGAWFNDKTYFIGLSLQNLIPVKWPNVGNNSRYRFHTQLNAGYKLSVTDNFSLLPAAILRIPPSGPVSIDLNFHADYRNLLGLGIGYRNVDALILFASIKFNEQFAIAYSFDYNLSQIQLAAQNTHEISLRFTTCKPNRSTSSSCPLFE